MKIPKECRFMFYEVGDGSKIFLWHDRWLPYGTLYQEYGHRLIYDAASSFNVKEQSTSMGFID